MTRAGSPCGCPSLTNVSRPAAQIWDTEDSSRLASHTQRSRKTFVVMADTTFSKVVYEQIRSAWAAANEGQRESGASLMEADSLARFIDPAFRASCQREEGHHVKFSVIAMARQDVLIGATFRFDRLHAYSDQELRKLARAFDPVASALLVDASRDELPIWGFGYFGSATHHTRDLLLNTGTEALWPEELMLRVENAGVVSISKGSTNLGVLEFGTFKAAVRSPFAVIAMGHRLMRISTEVGVNWHSFRDALDYLLRRVGQMSHGATVVVVPSSELEVVRKRLAAWIVPTGSFEIADLLRKIRALRPGGDIDLWIAETAYRHLLRDRLDAIARLASVDGALVITPAFEVVAIGAKLTSPGWPGPVVIGTDCGSVGSDEPFDIERHGTRHRSAVAIVGEFQDVIAFVNSSDGPIRGFAKDGAANRVLCWPDIRASMVLER
jgi:hypothetical protein